MDVIERLNRKFGAWYEGLFGASSDRDLRPRDILHRLISAMEDARREGLDGQVYVPNVYTLQIAVTDDDERDYLRTFLSADDLSDAVQRAIDQHGYRVKGGLSFQIEEIPAAAGATGVERVRIRPRFDTSIAPSANAVPSPPPPAASPSLPNRRKPAPPVEGNAGDDEDDDYEPGTVASLPAQVLASLVVRGNDGRLRDVYPIGAQKTSIGRGKRSGNEIILANDGMVSKRHAAVQYDEGTGRFFVRDEGSTNGTFLNGVRLSPGQANPLEPGDQVLLGETTFIFRPTDEPSVERPRPASQRVSSPTSFRTPAEQPLMPSSGVRDDRGTLFHLGPCPCRQWDRLAACPAFSEVGSEQRRRGAFLR
ncbi:MAG: FhaA domain-containing protein [Armatimonadota bacterium]